MSGLGVGRGRGWLKLERNQGLSRPGPELKTLKPCNTQIIPREEEDLFEDLIKQFDCLENVEDGILLNDRLKHIRSVFMKTCETEEEMKRAADALSRRCLKDESLIEKVLTLTTSAFFIKSQTTKEQICWKNIIRSQLLNSIQSSYENRDLLRKTTPFLFYNSLKLCSSFFRNNNRLFPLLSMLQIEVETLLGYCNLLLTYSEPHDIKVFVNLVCDSAVAFKRMHEEKNKDLVGLIHKLKMKIIDGGLQKNENLMLFFSLDLIRNKHKLSSDELAFYQSNFKKQEIEDFLVKHNFICEMDKNCQEKEENSQSQEQKLNSSNEREQFRTKSFNCEEPPKECKEPNTLKNHEEKVLRPILGVGARLKKH